LWISLLLALQGLGDIGPDPVEKLPHLPVQFVAVPGGEFQGQGPVGFGEIENVAPVRGRGLSLCPLFQEAPDGRGAAGAGLAGDVDV